MPWIFVMLFALALASRKRELPPSAPGVPWTQEHNTLYAGPFVQLQPTPHEGWEGGAYRFLPNHVYAMVMQIDPKDVPRIFPQPGADGKPLEYGKRLRGYLERWGDALERAITWHRRNFTHPGIQERLDTMDRLGIPVRSTVLVVSVEPVIFIEPRNPSPFGALTYDSREPQRVYAMGLTASDAEPVELKASAFLYVAQAAWAGA